MNKKMNSTEALSKKFSRINIPNSVSRQNTPNRRPASSQKKIGKQILQQALIAKNKKLAIMIRNMHHFSTNIQQIQWILDEAQKLIDSYMKKTLNKYGVSHQMQIQNINNQLCKLIQRFTGIDRIGIRDMTVPLKPKNNILSQNTNWWNIKRNQTIGSFKYTQMDQAQNQQEGPVDFSRINLPTVVKENASLQNLPSQRNDYSEQIRQYKATISILNEEITKLQNEKQQIKRQAADKMQNLKHQLNNSLNGWQQYRGAAIASISKCKHMLIQTPIRDRQQIERLLNEFFILQNKINQQCKVSGQNYEQQQGKRVRELSELDWKIKEKRYQLQRKQINSIRNTPQMLNNPIQSRQSWTKMLLLQAATIQQILNATQQ